MQNTNTNSTNIQQKLCLATVSSKEYWPGTFVMIKSFLKHNKWFDGDIAVITSDTDYLKKKLTSKFKNVKIVKPSAELTKKISEISSKADYLSLISDRFLKLEIFGLNNYDKVIYYDSDIFHITGVPEKIVLQKQCYASSDPAFIRGFYRDRNTMQKVNDFTNIENHFPQFVNSGFIIIDRSYINASMVKKVIETMDLPDYSCFQDKLADEPVLNIVFENSVEIAPQSFNCSVHLIAEGFVKGEMYSVHFTGKYKPWKKTSWIHLILRNPFYFKYLKSWLLAYLL